MTSFAVHPSVYSCGDEPGLLRMLERVWVQGVQPGEGTIAIVSGFGAINGAVRFLDLFRRHHEAGGEINAIFAGSTAQHLTSRQLVEELLGVGAAVYIVNRKRLLHAKLYGSTTPAGHELIVSSGNFTGPGLSLNVEASIHLGHRETAEIGFSWDSMMNSLLAQPWDIYQPSLSDRSAPAWKLLYDELGGEVKLEEGEDKTLVLTLSHSDTARIQASPGADAGKGTQYFWLSKDSYGFFPPLTIRNKKGQKATFSCRVDIDFVDLAEVRECMVTFEAENNFDFRLGTAPFRYTKLAKKGDLAALSRLKEWHYQLRIIKRGSKVFQVLRPYAVNFIGHRGKHYGYIDNDDFAALLGVASLHAPKPN